MSLVLFRSVAEAQEKVAAVQRAVQRCQPVKVIHIVKRMNVVRVTRMDGIVFTRTLAPSFKNKSNSMHFFAVVFTVLFYNVLDFVFRRSCSNPSTRWRLHSFVVFITSILKTKLFSFICDWRTYNLFFRLVGSIKLKCWTSMNENDFCSCDQRSFTFFLILCKCPASIQ